MMLILLEKFLAGPAHLVAKLIIIRQHWKARK